MLVPVQVESLLLVEEDAVVRRVVPKAHVFSLKPMRQSRFCHIYSRVYELAPPISQQVRLS